MTSNKSKAVTNGNGRGNTYHDAIISYSANWKCIAGVKEMSMHTINTNCDNNNKRNREGWGWGERKKKKKKERKEEKKRRKKRKKKKRGGGGGGGEKKEEEVKPNNKRKRKNPEITHLNACIECMKTQFTKCLKPMSESLLERK